MQGKRTSNRTRAGFTLIELAIVLAVTSLLTAGLWRMMSSGNTQLRDQAAADQHRELIKAVRGYLASQNGVAQLTAEAQKFALTIPAPGGCPAASPPNFCNFLPVGFTNATRNSYDQAYEIMVLKDTVAGTAPNVYSFMIKTVGGDAIPDTSGGRISSMIGADGGFVYEADVCGLLWACGAYSSWNVEPIATYGFTSSDSGHVASRTSVGTNASLETPWLARIPVPGDGKVLAGGGDLAHGFENYNTIQTDISLGGKTIFGVGDGYLPPASPLYGGEIVSLRSVELGRTATDNAGDVALSLVSACQPDTIDEKDASGNVCTDIANITGGVNIDGVLKANKLFAGTFIYNTGISSDMRLKNGIKLIENPLLKLSKINGYSFVMKDADEKKLGVLAQEVELIFPELVMEGSNGYKAVDYIGLIGPLVASVGELKKQNDDLKKEIELLKKKIK